MSNKVYEIITNEIIKKLEDGVIPWECPWDGMYAPKNFASGKEYRGINTILLGMQPYWCPFWATFKQIQNNYGMHFVHQLFKTSAHRLNSMCPTSVWTPAEGTVLSIP